MSPETSQASSAMVSTSPRLSSATIADKSVLSTPTKHTINVCTSDTPTSKCSLIVLEEEMPVALLSTTVSEGISGQTSIKAAAISNTTHSPTTSSIAAGVIPKKRGQPSSAQPIVKKLFKENIKSADDGPCGHGFLSSQFHAMISWFAAKADISDEYQRDSIPFQAGVSAMLGTELCSYALPLLEGAYLLVVVPHTFRGIPARRPVASIADRAFTVFHDGKLFFRLNMQEHYFNCSFLV
ncbi:hypothetical protein ABZP36_022172 [Zizania latifolia]